MTASVGREPTPAQRDAAQRATLLLCENQRDHAELMLEALETAFPHWRVVWSSGAEAAAPGQDADILILSLSTDLDDARRRASAQRDRGAHAPLVLLKGPADRWSPADLPGGWQAVILDKRAGASFLRRLTDAVRAAWSPRDAAPAPAELAAPLAEPAGAAPGPAWSAPVAGDERATTLAAGLLVDSLDELLERLSPLVDLFRARFPTDAATACYADNLDRELARARAIARRLAAVAGPEAPPQARLMAVSQLATLRAAAWRRLAPAGVVFDIPPGSPGPAVEVFPEVFAKALDDLVAALCAAAPAAATIRIETGALAADDTFCSARSGLAPGRYAHLRVALAVDDGAARQALVPLDPASIRSLARPMAAIKAHGAFLELTCEGADGALRQIDIYAPAAPPRRRPQGPGAGQTPSLLFVDDDAAVRSVGLEMLAAAGFGAKGAASGEEALALFAAGCRYDLVLLDLFLGGMNGDAAFARLKALDPAIAVVLASGDAPPDVLRGLLDQGLLGFLPKPFTMHGLVEIVRAGLGAGA